jgi:hypothetical protein
MGDLVFILLTVVFFALASAYIAGCGRVLGRGPSAAEASVEAEPRTRVPG